MRRILLFSLMALGAISSFAQTDNFMVSYPISFPLGNLHDYTSSTSFRGINMEFNKKMKPGRTVGLEVGWNVFYQHVNSKVYTQGTASISGAQYRYTNAVPIILGTKLYPKMENKGIKPYLGLGAGTMYANRSTDFGLYRISSDAWQFCIRPEVGIEFKGDEGVSGFVGAKYYWSFNEGDLDGQRYLSINIGFKFSRF
ncbi:MAG TPA: hypothetical protein VGN00_05985 [Puia sp.]|jgi:hypothetical protein